MVVPSLFLIQIFEYVFPPRRNNIMSPIFYLCKCNYIWYCVFFMVLLIYNVNSLRFSKNERYRLQLVDIHKGTGKIWLDVRYCNYDTLSIQNCIHRGWGNHNCTHDNDIGVLCASKGKNDYYTSIIQWSEFRARGNPACYVLANIILGIG